MSSPPEQTSSFQQQSRAIVFALFFPTMAIILNGSMYGVALPTIREEFGMADDVTAWLTVAFSLPFMMLMPLFGRLGDQIGKARLLLLSIIIFFCGAILIWFANDLPQIFLGRAIQGVGGSGITPLSLAIISQRYDASERGKALGTWNSVAPFTSIFAPTVGGALVDNFGWRTILIPITAVAVFAFFISRSRIKSLRGKPNWSVLRTFDWIGSALLSGTITFLVFYLSSRPITGVDPLRDWRLAIGCIAFAAAFVNWEKRHADPLIDLATFRNTTFVLASLGAGFRMAMMSGIGFLLPLYLTDLYELTASTIGLLATVHSVFLFIFIRTGGTFADRVNNRRLIALGMSMQALAMLYFALLPQNLPLWWIGLGAMLHGSGAGLSIAALHRTALGSIADDQAGSAAGVYSMTRFAGSLLATAITGVILQTVKDSGVETHIAYQIAYGFLVIIGILGVLTTSRLRIAPSPT